MFVLALKSLEGLILRDKCYTVCCFLLEEKIATNPKFYNAININSIWPICS